MVFLTYIELICIKSANRSMDLFINYIENSFTYCKYKTLKFPASIFPIFSISISKKLIENYRTCLLSD